MLNKISMQPSLAFLRPGITVSRDWLRVAGRPALILALFALASLLLFAAQLRFEGIEKGLPYPGHVDEPNITEPAIAMLKTSDFNPHYFVYPSLPTYLIAAAFTAGYLSEATHGAISGIKDIGIVGFPFYTRPKIVEPALALIVVLSLLSFLGIGWAGWELARRGGSGASAALFLGPFALFFSNQFFYYSHAYLQVNIFGDAFFWLLIAYLLWRFEAPGFVEKSLVPGVLGGLVLGCKYNFLWIVVAPLLAIGFHGETRRLAKSVVLIAVTVTTFFLTSPYCLLDLSTFLDQFAGTTSVYHDGLFSNNVEPGWPHFWLYVREIVADFGIPSLFLAVLGVIAAVRACWRRTLMIVSFPLLVMIHMSQPRAHFLRNALSGFPTYALFVGLGALSCWRGLEVLLARWPKLAPRWRHALAGGLSASLLLAVLPLHQVGVWRARPIDSRTAATAWILDSVPPEATLVVPDELSMDVRPLRAAGRRVEGFGFAALGSQAALVRIASFDDPYLLLPAFGSHHWSPALAALHRETAEDLNLLAKYHRPLKTFGMNPVSLAHRHVMTGDPRFDVGPLGLDKAERERLGKSRRIDVASLAGEHGLSAEGRRFVFAKGKQSSGEYDLEPGTLRLHLTCSGTSAKGQPALLRIAFGAQPIGSVPCAEAIAEHTIDFALSTATRAAFSVELVNDAIEKLPDGTLRDRNATLYALSFYPLASSVASPTSSALPEPLKTAPPAR